MRTEKGGHGTSPYPNGKLPSAPVLTLGLVAFSVDNRGYLNLVRQVWEPALVMGPLIFLHSVLTWNNRYEEQLGQGSAKGPDLLAPARWRRARTRATRTCPSVPVRESRMSCPTTLLPRQPLSRPFRAASISWPSRPILSASA